MNVPYPTSRAEAERLIASLQKDFGIGPVTISPHFVREAVRKVTVGEHSHIDPESDEMVFMEQAQRDLVRIMLDSKSGMEQSANYGAESVTESLENSMDYLRSRLYQRGWTVQLFAPVVAGILGDPTDPANQDLSATASGFQNAFTANKWAAKALARRLEDLEASGMIRLQDHTFGDRTLPLMRYELVHTSQDWVPEEITLQMLP